VSYATITIMSESTPGGVVGWTGPKLQSRHSFVVRWIVYGSSVSPFPVGLPDEILYP